MQKLTKMCFFANPEICPSWLLIFKGRILLLNSSQLHNFKHLLGLLKAKCPILFSALICICIHILALRHNIRAIDAIDFAKHLEFFGTHVLLICLTIKLPDLITSHA